MWILAGPRCSLAALFVLALGLSMFGVAGCASRSVARPVVLDIHDFESDLAPYGDWIPTVDQGRVWAPHGVPATWRPYSRGRWVSTSFGWTWVSDWPWGWATFHYGRWMHLSPYGWVWIPDTVWGPAWVAWRTSGDWIGWAPLPPVATCGLSGTLTVTTAQIDLWILPSWWLFVSVYDFHSYPLLPHLAPLSRHRDLLVRTRQETRYIARDGIASQAESSRNAVGRELPDRAVQREVLMVPEAAFAGRAQELSPTVYERQNPTDIGVPPRATGSEKLRVYRPTPIRRPGGDSRVNPSRNPRTSPRSKGSSKKRS